ncbi:hypothetical protein CTheo_4994 [Ceratobasidium theobromae]|uniref:Uncharacterized protein n=1 Tax=Ceratobasidium theobromae TaxID=1582974 RepID=A0A5N5QIJ7_9AGAM|nr:hypothetical protein CTheo_4994 [Ceratobasidium theobromae]
MRRRAQSQAWTLSRVHRVLRPLRTKVAALAASLKRERLSSIPSNIIAPTPTPTRHRPPLRRTYQARRKRKRGGRADTDDDGQYLPDSIRPSKSKPKCSGKAERRWSPEVLEKMSAVVDAFRVLADTVYDEQVETGSYGGNILRLQDMCVRELAIDIEPSAMAAAGPAEDDPGNESGLVDITIVVDQKFEEIPEHLRRAAIIPYALSMIKQHIDTISPLPQLWNHLLAICLSSSASPSPPNTADILQICTNLFLASLHQPRSTSRGLASIHRNIVGLGPDKISREVFCQTFLGIFARPDHDLKENYTLPSDFGTSLSQQIPFSLSARSPTRTPARRKSFIPPTPPTFDPSADSDDLSGTLFPLRSFLSRPVAHLVAELGSSELLSFVEAAGEALLQWMQTDQFTALFRGRENAFQRKVGDMRSLAPRLCARIADWVAMVLGDVWSHPIDLADLERAALSLGRVVELTFQEGVQGQPTRSNRQEDMEWRPGKILDVSDPFCALTCAYFAKIPKGSALAGASSNLAALLYQLPLTARNCTTLVGTLSGLPREPEDTETAPRRRLPHFSFPEPISPSAASMSCDPATLPTFMCALRVYTRALSSANCPHLESTLLQLIVNERPYVEGEIEEMLEDAEARWELLDPNDPLRLGDKVPEEGWKWARSRWRWDEITNTWVERDKPTPFSEYMHVPRPEQPKTKGTKGKSKKLPQPREVIAVSSDTEVGQHPSPRCSSSEQEDADSDDEFAAIPNFDQSGRWIRSPIKTRQQSVNHVRPRVTYVSSDDDEYQEETSQTRIVRQNAARRARPTFNWNESETETETGETTSTSGSETDESDFDWTQYNSRYHPHDQSLSLGSSSNAGNTRRPLNRLSNVATRSSRRNDDSDQENRATVQVSRSARPPNCVASDPMPAAKRQRLVVELPILSKRPKNRQSPVVASSRPPVLGNHNGFRHVEMVKKPVTRQPEFVPRYPARTARDITTSTLQRLCHQFNQLSSDDDRDTVINILDDSDEDEDEDEDEVEESQDEYQMEMPSSDDMNLFHIDTPAPRRVRSRATDFWR